MTATSVIGQRTKNTLDGRDAEYHGYPILIGDLIAQLEGAAYVARGSVHNAGVGGPHEEDVPARVRDAGRAATASRSSRCSRCARPAGSSRPIEGPDYMHETLGEVHIMGELKVDGVIHTTEQLHAENVAASRRDGSQARRRRPRRGGLSRRHVGRRRDRRVARRRARRGRRRTHWLARRLHDRVGADVPGARRARCAWRRVGAPDRRQAIRPLGPRLRRRGTSRSRRRAG